MNAYTLANVETRRGDFTLRIKDCCLDSGGVTAVLGPNGCGKSTFLDLLAFMGDDWKGDITFLGRPIARGRSEALRPSRLKVGYLMQNPYLFNMSVMDNIGFGLKVRHGAESDRRKRVDAIMDSLLLSHLGRRNAHTLSGGEAQRVALARTLVLDADVFLLDEPTANVDRQNIQAVESVIRQLNERRKVTIVLTTHSQSQAYRMTRNLITIMDGSISNIGYENVFAGAVIEDVDGISAVEIGGGRVLSVASSGKRGRVTLAVDPHDIILSKRAITSSAQNAFKGKITRIEDVNGSLRVFVDVGVVLCALITQKSFQQMNVNIGQSVWVTFKANAVKAL